MEDYDDENNRYVMTRKSVIPGPEIHFTFSTKLRVMAIDLYLQENARTFSPFGHLALQKLRDFVDLRKDMTQESNRFFVEHACNQFFLHAAFLNSAKSGTHAKPVGNFIQRRSTKSLMDMFGFSSRSPLLEYLLMSLEDTLVLRMRKKMKTKRRKWM